MRTQFNIDIDLSTLVPATQQAVDEHVLPRLHQAVRMVAQEAHSRWVEAVGRAKLWDGERTAYMESIQIKSTGPFSMLVWSDYKYAADIENGRPARDLKAILDTSAKVRTTKDGRRYLIIPFRHNTPGNNSLAPPMPQHIHDQAKNLKASSIVGRTTRLSGTGAMSTRTRMFLTVPQNTYQWGERLHTTGAADKRYNNMYRFNTSTPGGGRSSTYLTFRTMVEGSKGWIVPPQPGLHIAEQVAKDLAPIAAEAFPEALKRDLA